MDLYEFDEREKEQDGMEITIDGLKIEIPEELIQERMELIGIEREKVQEMLTRQGNKYKKCLLFNKKYNEETFAQKLVDYLDSEMAIYRM